MIKKIILAVILLLIAGFIFYRLQTPDNKKTAQRNIDPLITELLVDAAVWYPSAPWTNPVSTHMQTSYGNLTGEQITATVTSDQAMVDHFEMPVTLNQKGFTMDNTLSADGPGSSAWGYAKTENNRRQIMLFSYTTHPTNTNRNEPVQFDCPCSITITVFVSNPFHESSTTGLSNPASQNCIDNGGTLSIQKLGNGSEYGLCNFEDNMSCEEWALYRGDCPAGGVKTTGFDTIGEMYCAWLGGKTLATPNSTCTLPNGTNCPTSKLYSGTCSAN